ncbi:hypothetical protein ACG2LH_07345 [Zhouia sp. PK063]|uniref:hypothetical protein n=1 Tax=Zhouia sp. PK063 TaxID=3373602 RepID=UPI0037B537A4
MVRDLKDLCRDDKMNTESNQLSKGHDLRFLDKLNEAMPVQKKKFKPSIVQLWGVAAAVIVVLGVTFFIQKQAFKQQTNTTVANQENKTSISKNEQLSLGDISPDLKKIQDYYEASINIELANLDVKNSNKKLIDGYLSRLSDLNEEYKKLNKELNEVGPNEQTLTAQINNLQLRLQLLLQLKERLKDLKNSNNENTNNASI